MGSTFSAARGSRQVIPKLVRVIDALVFDGTASLFAPFCDAGGVNILASSIAVRACRRAAAAYMHTLH